MLKIENPKKRIIAEFFNFFFKILFFPFLFSRKNPPEIFNKILILRLDHIGDVVMSSSVYRAIKKKFPKVKISVMAGSWAEEILKFNPYIDEIILCDCPWWKAVRNQQYSYLKWFLFEYPKIIKKIRNGKFDIGIDLRGDFRHILFFLFPGNIKFKLSYNRSGGEYLLDRAVSYDINMHEVDKNFKLLEILGIRNVSMEDKRPEIFITDEIRNRVEKLIKKEKVKDKVKVIIHPGAGNYLRRWEEIKFAEIIDWLKSNYNCEVFVVGSEEEKPIAEKIIKYCKNDFINFTGKLSILETAALIEKGDLFIGNDSAIGHIASCFDIFILTLFGPNFPERCRPYSPYSFYIYHKLPCSPCLQIKCKFDNERGWCMKNIKTDQVKKKISEIFEKINFKKEEK
ncbi:MAG: hypothetical protein DRP67_00300 [Candidatus Omnitrophota bacterium]|nr:MAG: hypothetical protein DRP67_00300 [Candidatus Omnitrophota bacterium]